MISFALFAIHLRIRGGSVMTCSAESVSFDSFTFRTTEEDAALLSGPPESVRLVFRAMTVQGDVCLRSYQMTREDDDGAVLFRVTSEDSEAIRLLRGLMQDIARYEHLKNSCDDAVLSAAYTGYPAEKEAVFASSFHEWRTSRLAPVRADAQWQPVLDSVPQLAAVIPFGQEAHFLTMPFADFWQDMLSSAGLGPHPLRQRLPDTVYLGSAYCARLLPDSGTVLRLAERCAQLHLKAVFQLPPMAEDDIPLFRGILHALAGCVIPVEVLIEDMGVPLLAEEEGLTDRFSFTAGPLLIRRRKDPRMKWWLGRSGMLYETSANSGAMKRLMKLLHTERFEWEACGYPIRTGAGDSLRLPFYQLNTATLCTLNAAVRHGDRGEQHAHEDCSRLCTQCAFLYGDALNIVGIGNTLFGFDGRSLSDGSYLQQLADPGLQRLVIDLK